MHRIKYTMLTPEQIGAALTEAKAPSSVKPVCGALVGKKLRINAKNEKFDAVLDYEFTDRNELTVSENGAAPVRCCYAAKTIKSFTMFTHLIPGTLRAYAAVIDWATGLVTVFEVFFAGEVKQAREVQREVYFGYIDKGEPAPEKLHTLTNRVEGKGFYWKTDLGEEILEFYPSVMYCSTVRLSGPYRNMTYCAPTDFIRLSEEVYIAARVEAEFSGMMTFKLIDLFTVKSVGFHLGFDEKDGFHYEVFEAEGDITGQLATLEPFTDLGEKISRAPSLAAKDGKYKGYRAVYRPATQHPAMTAEEVLEASKHMAPAFSNRGSAMGGTDKAGSKKMPVSELMVGKKVTVRYDDGPCWEYEFVTERLLRVRTEGESEWHEAAYEGFECAEEMFYFGHMVDWDYPIVCRTVCLDLSNSLTTSVIGTLGTPYAGNEVSERMIFGVIEGEGFEPPKYIRHHFTDELLGRSFSWNYSDMMCSAHVYSGLNSYSWTIFLPNNGGGMMWSSPCLYGKLRDDTYIFSWVEEGCNGSLGTLVFNTRTMHDAGFFFGADHKEGIHLRAFGAYARALGRFDIRGYVDPEA